MNIDYISGFFDGDGSIALSRSYSRSLYKSPVVSLTNTRLKILVEIKNFLKDYYSINSYISAKTTAKKSHHKCYQLQCNYRNAIKLCSLLKSYHPVKRYRINVLLKYYDKITLRNGKYTKRGIARKLALERLFHWHISYTQL